MWCCSPHMWPGSPADPPTSGTCPLWSAHSRGGVLAELGLPFPPAASSGRSRGHPRGGRSGCLLGGPGLASSLQLLGAVPAPPWFWEPAMQRHVGGGNVQVISVHLLPSRAALGTAALTVIPVLTPRNEHRFALTARNCTALRVTGWDCGHSGGTRPTDGGRRNLLRTGGWAGRLGWAAGPRRGLEMRGQTAACMRGQCSPAGWGTPRRLGKIGSALGDRAAVTGRGGECVGGRADARKA